jgi:hypothetical protein
MEVDETFAGRTARCATCGNTLKIPRQSDATPSRIATPTVAGAAVVQIEGEAVQVVPPMETSVLVAAGILGFSLVIFLVAMLSGLLVPPFALSCLIGGLVALIGTLMALSAWNTVKRSGGRKRGKQLATIILLGGAGLFLVFMMGGIVGFALQGRRPSSEENLAQIYRALKTHSDQHNGEFPEDLPTLVKENLLDRDSLSFAAAHVKPGTVTYMYPGRINLNEKFKKVFAEDMMIVYENSPDYHEDGSIRILLLNGKVVAMPKADWSKYRDAQVRIWQTALHKVDEIRFPPPPAPVAPPPTAPAEVTEEEPPAEAPAAPKAPTAPPPAAPGAKK